ncbi:tetratricopeptide repeat protein [Methylophilus sp.]|jgi:Tfp pilus assembly protein PilF/SAM-dependent methyltransferase|uniref:tetratricopeptide repeat protein n=1 Tax=Methylophilus sp. TaxID=29541 RepID=UPI000D4A3388|nr:tetratricopeptide repeat protein [Methylophilus sp.]PPD13253.1 MAG: hypothetical protein CTY26_00085 [Methylophilus sp.]
MTSTQQVFENEVANSWKAIFKQDVAQAMTHAKKASIIAPDSPEVAHLLGVIACRDQRPDLALPLLQKALNGGATERRLRDMAEALLSAGHPQAALKPISDALLQFGESPALLGLKAAIEVALEQFAQAEKTAMQAVTLAPHQMAWETTAAFCQLINQQIYSGLQLFTARPENLPAGSRCPSLQFMQPGDIWLKNEQGPGDTMFYLRYAVHLKQQGFRLHIQADKKTKPLLKNSGLFESVKENIAIPYDGFWLNMGDLPLAAMQRGAPAYLDALPLTADPQRVEKIMSRLAQFGPGPYVAVTWRAGARGKKHRQGFHKYDKHIDPAALGQVLADKKCTVVCIQRVPEADEIQAFEHALSRPFLNYAHLNDQLQDMLALLTVVDLYVTVPNTNVHLRQSLKKDMLVLLNRPWQDWRWLAEGNSPWYPNANVLRQSANHEWGDALKTLNKALCEHLPHKITPECNLIVNSEPIHHAHETNQSVLSENINHAQISELLAPGWSAINQGLVSEAIRVAQEVLQQYPDQPDALHLLGWAAHRDLKSELAAGLLERAVSLAPENGRLLANLVRVFVAQKQFAKAEQVLDQALRESFVTPKAALIAARAVLRLQQNRIPEAVRDYEDCLTASPYSLDVMAYMGMAKLKVGDTKSGFRAYSARQEARTKDRVSGFVCPWLKGNLSGLKVLIKRDMGLGDELTFLRYLPWLTSAGVEVTYWAGKKLAPVLRRMNYVHTVIPDDEPLPDPNIFDLTFWVNELPLAVQYLDAPDIAPPLKLTPRLDLVEKWRDWLKSQGDGPFIGINWQAGASAGGMAEAFSKLAKQINPEMFARALRGINAQFLSLQRNVTKQAIQSFENHLDTKVIDVASITDDIEDLLALLSLINENVGVSNTNMHLRASLGLNSRVLVQCPSGDWRWGYQGARSAWFTDATIYREDLANHWEPALTSLRADLLAKYGACETTPELQAKHSTYLPSEPKVVWVTAGHIQNTVAGLSSDLASTRYRVISPMQALSDHGWKSEILNEHVSRTVGGWHGKTPVEGDTVIISKVFTEHAIKLAEDAKNRGAQVIVDFCDNHLSHPTRGQLQRALLHIADKVVCATDMLHQALAGVGRGADAVIADPINTEKRKAQFAPASTIKLLWFGHQVNLDTLIKFLPDLAEFAKHQPLTLNVLTTLESGLESLSKWIPSHLEVSYTPWSVEATSTALEVCDLVVIPTLEHHAKSAKSANRLLESMQAGRMVVAGKLPAYLPFADSAWVGEDLIKGIEWCLSHPGEVIQRIQQGQKDIASYFSPAAIGQLWQRVISNEKSLTATAPNTQPLKKLNLGCGDKILPGYINVDVVESRAGKNPDVLCDLHKLTPFEDQSVDEILSVHVIEHFWRWEVLDILKEWTRVLKPGGRMVLECPNLKSACEEFLKNPDAAAFGGPEGQRSMWVFYGDPRWQDPYMVHRWGYTPDSLAALMQQAGLVNARQEPAQYKLREPRDMRIVAEKPNSPKK